jgi:FkbM family methyltransferase
MISLVDSVIQLVLKPTGEVIKVRFSVDDKRFTAFVPDDNIWIAIKDVLLNREYEFLPEFELYNFTGGVIVDAGAHVGLFSLVASAFAERVIAIEPSQVNYHLLMLNLLTNNIGNVVPVNKALYHHKGKLRLFEGSHTGAHSLIGSSNRFEEVETITLEEIVDYYGSIDLLKIDIEGEEFELFNHIDLETLNCIKMIVGEIHLQHGDIGSIVNKLKFAGFKFKLAHPPFWKRGFSYRIELYGMVKLKILQGILYTLSGITGYKDKNLAILFAQRR